ncbi:hypothetical protein BD289DRAFT_431897 [Coniella lustricola]|uniref:Fucose-specific lectin n=1 Tax=Coniella lustricola TaxID=2025994 RepID=A0A2T3AAC0_9PEZI|nr:hypothetical protein BD289DRAFT_431897 [Coniella lustricola]
MPHPYLEDAAGDYSTLEYSASTQRTSSHQFSHLSQPGIEVAVQQAPETVSPTIYDQKVPTPDQHLKASTEPAVAPTRASRTRPWFLERPRRFWILAGVVILLIAAVVGGAVGGVLSSRRSSSSGSSSASTSSSSSPSTSTNGTGGSGTNTYVHVDSKLTATNYTDSDGGSYRAVFFQDTNSSVIGRIWNSQNSTWRTVNITDKLPQRHILAGSPLTATAKSIDSGQLHVWCVLQDQSIHDYYWDGEDSDPVEATWTETSTIGGAVQTVWAGSGLASAWQRPWDQTSDASGSWILAFQNTSGEIAVVNDTGPNAVAVGKQGAAEGTSLAMEFKFNQDGGTQVLMTYQSNSDVLGTTWPPFSNTSSSWNTAEDVGDLIIQDIDPASDGLQFANAPITNAIYLFLALMPNGTVPASKYTKEFVPIPYISFASGPSANFTAIATTSNEFFYGIWDDSVYEYKINTGNLGTFTYNSVVYP